MQVTRQDRRILEERLAATGGEFQVMRERIREATIVLGVIGCAQLLLPLVWTLMLPSEGGSSTPVLIENSLLGGGMLLSAGLVERRPRATLTIVLVAWCGYQIAVALSSPLGIFRGLFIKIVILVTLVRALFAARTAERIRTEMIDDVRNTRAAGRGA